MGGSLSIRTCLLASLRPDSPSWTGCRCEMVVSASSIVCTESCFQIIQFLCQSPRHMRRRIGEGKPDLDVEMEGSPIFNTDSVDSIRLSHD